MAEREFTKLDMEEQECRDVINALPRDADRKARKAARLALNRVLWAKARERADKSVAPLACLLPELCAIITSYVGYRDYCGNNSAAPHIATALRRLSAQETDVTKSKSRDTRVLPFAQRGLPRKKQLYRDVQWVDAKRVKTYINGVHVSNADTYASGEVYVQNIPFARWKARGCVDAPVSRASSAAAAAAAEITPVSRWSAPAQPKKKKRRVEVKVTVGIIDLTGDE